MLTTLTYTDIANMAIDWCGGALSIQSIDDQNNPDAIVCARNLPQAIRSELDKYEWAFAQRVVPAVLEQDESYKIDGYFCYSLPDDFSRVSMYLLPEFCFIRTSQFHWRDCFSFFMCFSTAPLSVLWICFHTIFILKCFRACCCSFQSDALHGG